ncbi:hypothetical protein GIB67_026265 [Kingdonia uniflora]|uniref:RING-type domain-containing protein n=1 Tax=Kingdonia uniflora TaxID=39325 RepID=A0A7J7L9Z1_9MAGN|nr:hypothetical protein GIB67_026265 [Kingdonia uniflora]
MGFFQFDFMCLCFVIWCVLVVTTSANVILLGSNFSLSFDDIEANFAPSVKASGYGGFLYLAEPIDACSSLTNKVVDPAQELRYPFALIVRGGCSFEDKVRRAQTAGFKAAIVYDNEDSDSLIAMAGGSAGIKIHAVFVSKFSGEEFKKYAGLTNVETWILPTFENSTWSIMAISFISLLAVSALLATCFFVRRHRIRRERPRSYVREFHGMSRRLVKTIPSLIFTAVIEDNSTSRTCAICLEDYNVGEKLRVLPCCHKFHALCVDSWLTTWRTFCPVCKRDVRLSINIPAASESTPLLSSDQASQSSSASLSSFRSSLASSAIRITPSSRSPSVSRGHSFSTTPFVPRSYSNSPALSLSRSTVDLRNASSQRSRASHLVSSYSLGYPSPSPLNSRYIPPYYPSPSNASPSYVGSSRYLSPYIPSPSNASPSYVGSSGRQLYLLHCNESAASLSSYTTSAQSLPGC